MMFDELAELGQTVTLHRLAGHVSSGGHHSPVFEAGEELTMIVRPWQSDFGRQNDAGYSGQTPGLKIFTNPTYDLDRGDRVHYRGEAFRLMNPHHDASHGLERWDGQTDERALELVADLDDGLEVNPPDERDL